MTKPNHKNTKAVHVASITEATIEECFALATKTFIGGSTLHQALGIGLAEYTDYLWPSFKDMIALGYSLEARDGATGKLLGVMVTTDWKSISNPRSVPKKFEPLIAIGDDLSAQYADYREVLKGDALLVDMGVVDPAARGLGVYKKLRQETHELAAKNGFRFVLGELSSAATQHVVCHNFGHNVVAEIDFNRFEFEGHFPFATIESPKSIVMTEGEIGS